jgi:hypothetical protein
MQNDEKIKEIQRESLLCFFFKKGIFLVLLIENYEKLVFIFRRRRRLNFMRTKTIKIHR